MLVFALIQFITAVTVTFKLAPHERSCYYADSKEIGEKLGFYFAVQEGGDFDVDYELTDPKGKLILLGQAERQGDYVLTVSLLGEYAMCFSNAMSTFAEKLIDFDLTMEHEVSNSVFKSEIEESVGNINSKKKEDEVPESIKKLREELNGLSRTMSTLVRTQRQIRSSEHRNFSMVKDAGGRMFWFAVLESLSMVGMAAAQVYIIQTFFSKSARTRV
ncbi:hypothetical protein HDV01_007578 [Terramyces sp. JEL0728]|nr:hypothetical protein HDV01_007578 [Terramyces sp. JEL0728]